MRLFKWSKIAICYNEGAWAKSLGLDIVKEAEKWKIKVVNPEWSREHPEDLSTVSEDKWKPQNLEIYKSGARILIFICIPSDCYNYLFPHLYDLGARAGDL